MPTAVLVDGAYFIKRFRRIEPHNAFNAERAADLVHRWATAHLMSSHGAYLNTGTAPTPSASLRYSRNRPPISAIFASPSRKACGLVCTE